MSRNQKSIDLDAVDQDQLDKDTDKLHNRIIKILKFLSLIEYFSRYNTNIAKFRNPI